MKHSRHVKPISRLQNHADEMVRSLSESAEPMLITQDGEAKLVVMSIDSCERQEETMAMLKLQLLGQQDIEQGRFRDAGEVLAELDAEEDL